MGYIWIKFGYQLDHNAPNPKLYARAPVFAKRSIVYVVPNMRIILRTMDLPGKSAALYRPRKSPIGLPKTSSRDFLCSGHGSTINRVLEKW